MIFPLVRLSALPPTLRWAEQQPDEWWALVTAVHQALADSGVAPRRSWA
ncbi:MAG: hypothetical protein R3A10_11605 [Caldilineaceae bacterium]